jgi:hypothetical protein
MGQPLKGVPKRELLGEALQGVVGVSFLGNGQLLEGLECVRGCHRSVAVPFFAFSTDNLDTKNLWGPE